MEFRVAPWRLPLIAGWLASAWLPARTIAQEAPPSSPAQRVEIEAPLDAEWGSYRRAYGATAFFERFTRTRALIQAQFQVRPVDPQASLENLHVAILGASTHIDVAVDAIGRADLPQSKTAYDEDAIVRLDRPKGRYVFSGRYSIRPRADGIYDAATLREACEQLIDAQRASGYRMRLLFRKCAGIKFVYPRGDVQAAVEVEAGGAPSRRIAAIEAHPFEDDSMGLYSVVVYRFADWPAQGRVLPKTPPLAIGTLYE